MARTPDVAPILLAKGVRKVYRTGAEEVEALKEIDLAVSPGEFVAVMGPSGSGKTTLLNCLSGLDEIDEGIVEVAGDRIHELPDGERTRKRADTMGFVFQAFNLIPVFTAMENTELPLLLAGQRPDFARERALETLKLVGLEHRVDHRPNELSGGEQQRVTVARALAGRPSIVWADEPTGNLDTETAERVMQLIHDLHREGLTIMLVTHDAKIAGTAQRLISMRDGRIEADEMVGATKPKPRAKAAAPAKKRATRTAAKQAKQ
ncbi:MAG TPA: ABC transporter ATP-binding protein [Acidimicrobiia bacterium]|nr:ABC transporter ATP-binding protein [Acidimicrobiia bacterium]